MLLSELIKQLQELKIGYGDIQCADIDYGHPDRPQITVTPVEPCVVTNPEAPSTYLLIFD